MAVFKWPHWVELKINKLINIVVIRSIFVISYLSHYPIAVA